MKTLKKWIAFMLAAGLIVSAVKVTAVTVLADYDGEIIIPDVGDGKTFKGPVAPTEADGLKAGDFWLDTSKQQYMKWTGSQWVIPESSGGSSSSDGLSSSDGSSGSGLTQEDIEAMQSQAEALAVQQGASDEGFADVGDMYRAAEKNMSAGEYYNNVVISTPGIENAVTVGQGGNIVVNGVVTNMTAMISKVTNRAYVDSVRVNESEGRLLNVVEVSYPGFDATINFYMPSVTAEMDIVALQYSAGTWVNVDVAEVREDHVVLDMKKSGIVAFIAK